MYSMNYTVIAKGNSFYHYIVCRLHFVCTKDGRKNGCWQKNLKWPLHIFISVILWEKEVQESL